MRKRSQKIFIIGAGPIGCYLAQLLKKKSIQPVLIEEHKKLGRPVHCAGLIGKKSFEESQIHLSPKSIINTVNGAKIHLNNEVITVTREKVAYVIDREKFDKSLGEGLDVRFSTKFLGLEEKNHHYIIETDKGDFEADIVIGADGAKSLVRDFVTGKNIEYLTGVQFRMKYKTEYKDRVEVYIKRPYFYWIIPEQEDIVRIGVISKTPYKDLLKFIKEKRIKGKILEKFAGIVPLDHFSSLSKGRIFLVGDSACQIKPLTYGGVYMGMRGAEILAKCIVKDNFSNYSLFWKRKFGREVAITSKIRETLHKLNDKEISRIFSFVKSKNKLIEEKGDFENHSFLLWELLRQPDVTRELFQILLSVTSAQFRK
ncbi:MAG: geranylgeranyl reductase family protein [Candidatus Omnitrophica bacterium]|jgi:geranylgeranyl reductase family protein|nr:geranylgeranyl reductase family protein [Candidatus Omnitrophota bacterium]